MRLRKRLTLALTLAAVLPTAAVAHLVGRDLVTAWRRETIADHQSQTVLAALAVQAYLQRAMDLIATNAQRPSLLHALATGSAEAFAEVLQGLDRQAAGFERVFALDAEGILRLHDSSPGVVGSDFSHRDYYRSVLRTGRPYVSAPFIGQVSKEPVVAVTAPIRDRSGRLRGLLAGSLALRRLSEITARLPGRESNLTLVGPGGVILAHRDAGRLMEPARTADPAIARVLAGESGWAEWTDPGGARQLSVFAPVHPVGWGLVHTQSLDAVYAPIRAGRRWLFVVALFAVGAGTLGGTVLARGLVRPILVLREGVRRLAAGELRVRLNLRHRNELGELGRDIDTMAERLEAQVRELERRMRELGLLQQVERGILTGTPIPELLQPALQGLRDLAGARSCFILEPKEEVGTLRLLAADSMNPEKLSRFFDEIRPRLPEGTAGLAIATRAPVVSGDVAADARWGRLREAVLASGVRATVAVPLMAEEEVLGALSLTFMAPRPFPADEVQTLQRFADQLAIAFQQARLREAAAERFRLQEAHRVKSLFLANMSHEIRTPLNAILGFGDLLQMEAFGPLNEKQRRYVGHIHQASRHLLQLINDILDLSKAEAGQFTLSPEAVPLESTLEAALLIVKGQATQKRISLSLDPGDGLGTVRADPIRLKQMLFNLLSNAVKFTPEDGRVTLAARRTEGDVEIAVSDTGIGIRAEDLPRLFVEFSQLGPQRQEGTGLGLALTKRLVELHGGTIRVDSAPGEGSTFTLTLPERAPADGAIWPEPAESVPAMPVGRRPRSF